MKRFASTLLTVSTILISSTSIVFANPTRQSATIQNSVQESYINGEHNVTRQDSRQMRTDGYDYDGVETPATDITMQQSRQKCDVYGRALGCSQSNQQEHHSRRRQSSNNY